MDEYPDNNLAYRIQLLPSTYSCICPKSKEHRDWIQEGTSIRQLYTGFRTDRFICSNLDGSIVVAGPMGNPSFWRDGFVYILRQI